MIYIKPLKSVCAVLVSCLLFGCAKPEGSHNDADSTPSISFPVNPVMVPSSGGNMTAAVNCDDSWTAVSQSDWITSVEPASDNAAVLFVVAANPEASPRDGKITFSFEGSSYTKDLTVRQAANLSMLTVSVKAVELSPEGEEEDIVIIGEDWSVKNVSADWLEVKKKNSSAITVSAPINYSGSDLNAEIVIGDAAGNSATVSVSQKYDYELFKGASTVEGRKFVYKSAGLVTSVGSDKSYRIDDNVSVLEICYEGEVNGSVKPTALFVYEVNLNSDVTLKTTCAFDDNSSIKTSSSDATQVQIVREQLNVYQDNHPEFTVLGGVNGDFFFDDRNNLLHGVFYRGGNCLKDTFDGGAACTVFAMMKDGVAKVMTQAVYDNYKTDIVEAIGGRQQILSNGSNVSNDDTLEPRTAVGVSSDGRKVWLIIVDGRNPVKWSAGASYPMMAKMFTALGAYNAINLDGGGSSTFVTSENGAFKTVNKVTDSTGERGVVNGIAIVKNK